VKNGDWSTKDERSKFLFLFSIPWTAVKYLCTHITKEERYCFVRHSVSRSREKFSFRLLCRVESFAVVVQRSSLKHSVHFGSKTEQLKLILLTSKHFLVVCHWNLYWSLWFLFIPCALNPRSSQLCAVLSQELFFQWNQRTLN